MGAVVRQPHERGPEEIALLLGHAIEQLGPGIDADFAREVASFCSLESDTFSFTIPAGSVDDPEYDARFRRASILFVEAIYGRAMRKSFDTGSSPMHGEIEVEMTVKFRD